MKRLGQLWDRLISWDNLLLAYHKARRGKRSRPDVAQFALALEPALLKLQQQLRNGSYRPGAYRQFTIYDRKPRLISAAPFRDRVVHHAVMNIIEPPLDQRFIDDCYACRRGKGVHAAVNRYQAYAQQYDYALKLDIRQYFPSIDHLLLKQILARRIKDPRVLQLLAAIIDGSPPSPADFDCFAGDDLISAVQRRRGIPIGNLTSQFFANLYLDDFDHWLKQDLRMPAYLRYVDDLILLDNDKARLWQASRAIESYLQSLRLRLHPQKRQIYRTTGWVDVLGYRVSRTRRLLRNDNGYRFQRTLKRMAQHYRAFRSEWRDIDPRVQSWLGHARHAETAGLCKSLFDAVPFQRGHRPDEPSG